MKNLLQNITTKTHLSVELAEEIKSRFKPIETAKGDKLLLQDRKADYLYFIEKGILHNYYFQDGRQVSSWFYREDQFITSWYSFYSQAPSFEEIECLEDCVLYRISYSNYQRLIADFPAFGNFARLLAEEMLSFLDHFSKGWAFLSAREKYQLLTEYFPDIEQRVKLGYIATFMGISQETLSRIRSKR
ncbi:MAG: Crp/Fnr family transcriptional regulator [Bacteroidota bacterium]